MSGGQGYIFTVVPVCVLIMMGVILLGAIAMNPSGASILRPLGGNEEAARLSGISIRRTRVIAYVICGLLAAVSGVVMMSRVNSGQPLSGTGMEIDALIACVVGGIGAAGGEGRAAGF